MNRLRFREGFLWGSATSDHQVEGGPVLQMPWFEPLDPPSDAARAAAASDRLMNEYYLLGPRRGWYRRRSVAAKRCPGLRVVARANPRGTGIHNSDRLAYAALTSGAKSS